MKKIKVCYSNVNNMGDMLNKDLLEYLFNCEVKQSSHYNADLIAIGSGLSTYLFDCSTIKNIKKIILGIIHPKVYVWGTGFLNYNNNNANEKFYKKQIKICSVRGNLTKKRIEKILGKKIDVPTGDGGLLSSYLLEEMPAQKYDLGIIPHFREKDDKIFLELQRHIPNSIIIDVQDSPINVIKKIAECKNILSSSLHGLIISDSLNIPNLHIVVSNKLLGDGYKFDDYYSAYNIKHYYITKKNIENFNIEDIKKNYKIKKEDVEKKKKDLLECFPFKN